MEMPIPYFKQENKDEIEADISRFQSKHPEGKLAVIKVQNLDLYYNVKGPNQTDEILDEVIGVFRQVGMEWFAYRNYGRWLVGFYQEDTEEKIRQEIGQLEIKTDELASKTVTWKGKSVQLDPFKVSVEIEYITLEDLFKKKE